MKINLEISGGFAHIPGLQKPIALDTRQMDSEVANELESVVRNSHFFELPIQNNSQAKGAADYRTYSISIEDGTQVHTIQLTDPIKDSNLQHLVSRIQSIARQSNS